MFENKNITIYPSTLSGSIEIPSSKSLSHRALIAAALSNGKSKISNIIYSKDIIATINALEQIGAKFTKGENDVLVQGVKKIKVPNKDVFCDESGSTLRFLIPILSLTNKQIVFTGAKSLISRPQSIYEEIYKEDNNIFEKSESRIITEGSIKSRIYNLEGNVSSQFFTGLMFSLPLLKKNSYIYIKSKLESKSYIDLTIEVLEKFGIKIMEIENGYFIEGNQKYIPTNYEIEGDFSQAAFFLVAGVINKHVNVKGLNFDSKQGDRQIIDIIKQVKGRVTHTENGYNSTLSKTTGSIVDISDCPDLGPIISLLLSLSNGESRVVNAGRLRLKESDRIKSTVDTLRLLGANIDVDGDDIIIHGRKSLGGGIIVNSFNDHRIAMMVCIAASVCEKEVIMKNPNSVMKSYPDFYKDYISIGGIIE